MGEECHLSVQPTPLRQTVERWKGGGKERWERSTTHPSGKHLCGGHWKEGREKEGNTNRRGVPLIRAANTTATDNGAHKQDRQNNQPVPPQLSAAPLSCVGRKFINHCAASSSVLPSSGSYSAGVAGTTSQFCSPWIETKAEAVDAADT